MLIQHAFSNINVGHICSTLHSAIPRAKSISFLQFDALQIFLIFLVHFGGTSFIGLKVNRVFFEFLFDTVATVRQRANRALMDVLVESCRGG